MAKKNANMKRDGQPFLKEEQSEYKWVLHPSGKRLNTWLNKPFNGRQVCPFNFIDLMG